MRPATGELFMQRPATLAALLSIAVVIIGLANGTWVAGGMDSYGYISQSDRWLAGQLVVPEPALDRVPWPNALETLAPIGYVPAPDGRSTAPYYSPGLSLLMAGAQLVGGHCAVFWVVPISGGVLVAATFAIGRRVRSPTVGLVAAALVATSPAMLFMVTSPMSDVPAAACWAIAIAAAIGPSPLSTRRALAAGIAAGVAILIRPNLVPLAAIIGGYLLLRPGVAEGGRDWRGNLRAALAFSVFVIVSAVVVAWLNNAWFGSPLKTGPGDLTHGLFSLGNLLSNLIRYPTWFIATQTPLALFGVVALVVPSRRLWPSRSHRAIAVVFAAICMVTLFIHALFVTLEEWWYLRYLLAAWPAVFVGFAMVLGLLLDSPRTGVRLTGILTIAALCVFGLRVAKVRGAFNNAPSERRYVEAAKLVDAHTEPDAVILAMQHSGTIRYYAGRMTLRYDWLPDDWLDRAVSWIEQQGRHVYFLLEEWELDRFRSQFAAKNDLGSLQSRVVFRSLSGGPQITLFDSRASAGVPPEPVMPASLDARCDHPADVGVTAARTTLAPRRP